ncbi:TPA: hypothetical protein OGU99_000764 [Escherichia coli]|nr:hypothetical protein [Escherichia coli]HCQ0858831.1 hypothetical protein [Escherichia coli]
MNIKLVKKYISTFNKIKFINDGLTDPEEQIKNTTYVGQNCFKIIIENNVLSLSVNNLVYGDQMYIVHNVNNNNLEIMLRDDNIIKIYQVQNVSECTTEEGYFQESLVQTFNIDFKDLKYLMSTLTKMRSAIFNIFFIDEQRQMDVK